LVLLAGVRPLGGPAVLSSSAVGSPGRDTISGLSDISEDLRVKAFLEAYGSLIDRVTFEGDDAVFISGNRAIHFTDGKMLAESHLAQADAFEPFFFSYSLEPLTRPPPLEDGPGQSTDVLEAFFGGRESEIRAQCESMTFLGRRLFVNKLASRALREVERDIQAAASRGETDVARWVDELEIAYSFMNKGIAGSESRSYHAWGLAVDLVPRSYGGKQVYWRWSRVFNRTGWHRIPLSERWSPPEAVVAAFERHGFLWGGKWAHFDTIHFEYRPEILIYNRLVQEAADPKPGG
jgi:hypothetical protein